MSSDDERTPREMARLLSMVSRQQAEDGQQNSLLDQKLLLALEAYFGEDTLASALDILDDYRPQLQQGGGGRAGGGGDATPSQVPVVRFRLKGSPDCSFISVRGSRGLPYTITDLCYCPCASWQQQVFLRLPRGLSTSACKHLLAARLAEAAGTLVETEIESRQEFTERMLAGSKGHH